MKSWMIVLLVLLTLSVGGFIIKNLWSHFYSKRIMKHLLEGNAEFLRLIDSFAAKVLFDPYYRENLKLNYYIVNGNDVEIRNSILLTEDSSFTKNQKMVMYQTAFSYYVSNLKRDEAVQMLKRIKEFVEKFQMDTKIIDECQLDFDIYIDKKLSVIHEIDRRMHTCIEREKVGWIAKKVFVLKENGKIEEAKLCLEQAIETMHDATNQSILIKLLENGF